MTAPDLKPCPFCGEADPETLIIEHLEGTILHPAYRVLCDNCGASTGYSDRGDHVTAWNTRAPLAEAAPDPACDHCGMDPAAIREAALQLAVTAVRQALVDAAHAHRADKPTSSAMFKAETYATNAILALIAKGAAE